jgi:hypothetical protein
MYIPPSQYKTGFYSNGEYTDLNGTVYIGPYFQLNNGTKYSGNYPTEGNNFVIIIPPPTDLKPGKDFIEENTDSNAILNLSDSSLRNIPLPYYPFLTDEQKTLTFINRYFVKDNREFLYMEINKDTYNLILGRNDSIAWDLYSTILLEWKIKGDPYDIVELNKKTINNIEQPYSSNNPIGKNWAGFSKIFNDNYLEFYQDIQENLSTSGGEYKTKNGEEYIGLYHIHPDKGPMVGPTHVSTPHGYLYPINKTIPKITTSSPILSQPTQPTTPPPSTPPPSTGGSYSGGGY